MLSKNFQTSAEICRPDAKSKCRNAGVQDRETEHLILKTVMLSTEVQKHYLKKKRSAVITVHASGKPKMLDLGTENHR